MGKYRVFGRKKHADPLSELGELPIENTEETYQRAVERFGSDWVELTLIPDDAIYWVLRNGKQVEGCPRSSLEVGVRDE